MVDWINLIQTVGFPIGCAIALSYALWKGATKLNEQNIDREHTMQEFIRKQTDTLTKLASTNQSFVTVLESFRTDMSEMRSDIEDIKSAIRKEEIDE